MLVCFLGVQTYLSGRCLFAFYVFRRIEISEWKMLVCFLCFQAKEMPERKVACLFSMCFRRIEFLHEKKLEIGLMTTQKYLSKKCLFAFYASYERKVACLFSIIFKRIEMSEWKMLVCFLGVQTYLSGRCLFPFYAFRRIEISEWKILLVFYVLGVQKYLSEKLLVCSLCFLGVKKCLSEKLLVCSLCVLGVQNFFIKKN